MRRPAGFLMNAVLVSCFALMISGCGRTLGNGGGMTVERIDGGISWANPLWGWHAPKLVFDGHSYYTIGHWGYWDDETQGDGSGVIYRREGDTWVPGYRWDDLDYQPGMLLLDSRGHLVVVYGNKFAPPTIKRSTEPGNHHEFKALDVPEGLGAAGYIGAAMHGDLLILGYISGGYLGDAYLGDNLNNIDHSRLFDFNIAILDLESNSWRGPYILARGQHEEVPFTTWRYAIIRPDEEGFHLAVSSGKDATSPRRHQTFHMRLPYEIELPIEPEMIDQVTPGAGTLCDVTDMHVAADGTVRVVGQYTEDPGQYELSVWKRPPDSRQWQRHKVCTDEYIVNSAFFQVPEDPAALWLLTTSRTTEPLRVFRLGDDKAGHWEQHDLPSLDVPELQSVYSMYMVNASSGSAEPPRPVAIFPSRQSNRDDGGPYWSTWFVEFSIPR